MFWVYVLIGFVLAFLGGVGTMFTVVFGTDPHAQNGWRLAAVFLLPVLGYWVGIVMSFLYALGEAFKGG